MVWQEALPAGDELWHANSPGWNITSIVNASDNMTSHTMCIGPDDTLHAAWAQYVYSNQCLFYANSTDWNSTQTCVEKVLGLLEHPEAAADSRGIIHIAWARSFSSDHAQVHYWNTGMLDEEPLDFSHFPLYANSPSIAVTQDDVVHVVWADRVTYLTRSELRRAKIYSTDAIAFASISGALSGSTLPGIATDASGNIHLLWHEQWGATPQSLYYMNSGK